MSRSTTHSAELPFRRLTRGFSEAERLAIRQRTYTAYGAPKIADFFGWVVSFLPKCAGLNVLDVGCGNGAFHRVLTDRGNDIIAIDRSTSLTRLLQFANGGHATTTKVICASAENLPLQSRTCDSAMANFMLHCLPSANRHQALLELRRVVKSGGTIVMANHSARLASTLRKLHFNAARSAGFTPSIRGYDTFTLASVDEVEAVFPGTRVELLESRIEVPAVLPVLEYYASFLLDFIDDRPADNRHRLPILSRVANEVTSMIEATGSYSDDISSGVFVSTVS